MSLSRRQFIQASGIALCAGAVPLKASAAGQQQPLPVPPLLESRRGQPLFMTVHVRTGHLRQGHARRFGESMVVTWGRLSASGRATMLSLFTATA